ncbi:hypothetical protein IWW34DRAFT_624832 [Fusarium oxysporum f. sp. albedinis]|nr:hypothetical protein IWW34DRAFT_624832 [Fusarium oxysporum f. sp. albedinis]
MTLTGQAESMPTTTAWYLTKSTLRLNILTGFTYNEQRSSASLWLIVFGRSWISALGQFYPEAQPERVGTYVVRGVLKACKPKLPYNDRSIAAQFFTDALSAFLNRCLTMETELSEVSIRLYHFPDHNISAAAARQWNR